MDFAQECESRRRKSKKRQPNYDHDAGCGFEWCESAEHKIR
jgi:hypothetical protein